MPDVNSVKTTLLDAINTGLSALGETPVSLPDSTSTNVVLAKQVIQEVSRDIQSKGWWFNTNFAGQSGVFIHVNAAVDTQFEDFSINLPEEARRYIAIRASRILQSRFLGSEDLYKFSMMEEQVSYAVLTQAHVRNGGDGTSFNSFPAALKSMGIEEFMFLQGNAEEKLLTIRLTTELNTAAKLAAETALVDAQELLVDKQTLTEVTTATKQTSESALIDAQELLVDNQAATELKTAIKTTAESNLLNAQKNEVTIKTAVEIGVEKSFYDGVVAGTQATYRDYAAEMRMMGVQESTFQQLLAYKKIEVLKDADKLRLATLFTPPETASAVELSEVNKIMRFIGEPSSIYLNNSLMVEALRLLRDTAEELQGRGWWFNTEKDVELPEVTEFVVSGDGGQWDGIYAYNATNGRYERTNGNNVHYFSKTDTNDTNTVGTWVLASEHPAGVYDETFDSNVGTGAYPDPALFEVGTLVVEHRVVIPADVISVEANDYDTIIKTVDGVRYLYDLKKKSYEHWLPAPVKATVIYNRGLLDLPQKFLEYLNVRVALILTELYPQSGADLQRLPKMEAELRIYFKDRDFDNANYTVFDNYDTASRIGINRNYNLF